MTHRLHFSAGVFQQICEQLSEPVEVAAVLETSIVPNSDGVTVAVRDVSLVPNEHYRIQRVDRLAISSRGWVPQVRQAASNGFAAVFLHTHPRGSAMFSAADDVVD